MSSTAKICLLTNMQPSTNPRLVKEADTLATAGFDVTVVYAYMADWAARADQELFRTRSWKPVQVGGNPQSGRARYFYTRARHRAGYAILARSAQVRGAWDWALSRVSAELIAAARRMPANLYIAHNLGALPAAIAGARAHGALAGFDAEDFYSDMVNADERSAVDGIVEKVEAQYLPQCDYVTAASPAMARAYARKYGIAEPFAVLNVFPLAERPAEFRTTAGSGPLTLYWFSQTIGAGRGIEDAIRAMGALGRQDVELYLQGTWAQGYREAVEGLARECGLARRQVNYLPPEAPAELVRRASTYDVGLALEQGKNRNRDITLTNKIFTYLLAGNAVAATSTEGQRPILEQIAPAGICYAPGDYQALAAALGRWLNDRGGLEAARRAAWEWGTREYNWDKQKSGFLNLVRRTLAGKNGRRGAAVG